MWSGQTLHVMADDQMILTDHSKSWGRSYTQYMTKHMLNWHLNMSIWWGVLYSNIVPLVFRGKFQCPVMAVVSINGLHNNIFKSVDRVIYTDVHTFGMRLHWVLPCRCGWNRWCRYFDDIITWSTWPGQTLQVRSWVAEDEMIFSLWLVTSKLIEVVQIQLLQNMCSTVTWIGV